MFGKAIQFILICLFIFTPAAYGSMDIWAFSLMELGILLIISLYAIQGLFFQVSGNPAYGPPNAGAHTRGAARMGGGVGSSICVAGYVKRGPSRG